MPRWSIVRWLSLENRSTCPFAPLHGSHGNIYIYIYRGRVPLFSLSLFFLSIKILSLSFTNLPRASPSKGRRGRRRKTNRIEFHPSRVAGNALTHQKEIKRVSAAGLSLFRASTIGARPRSWKRGKRTKRRERFIRLFGACLSTADTARGS